MSLFDPQKELYHYTSASGLMGVVTSKTIWATDISYLNDAQEFRYARSVVQRTLDRRLSHELSDAERTYYSALPEVLDRTKGTHVFVASFSTEGDMLSQWRAYCPEGSGFAIGFSGKALQTLAKAQDFELFECMYDPSVQEAQAEKLLMLAFHDHESAKRNLGDTPPFGEFFLPHFTRLAATMKHPSFHEEKEWRLVSGPLAMTNPRVKFRSGKRLLIPYVPFALERRRSMASLRSFRIGPTPDPDLTQHSLLAFMVAKDITRRVDRSDVPYRGWQ